jgi:hypothetical protein
MFKNKGLWVAVFKSIHIGALLKKRLEQAHATGCPGGLGEGSCAGVGGVYLATGILRGLPYPLSESEFSGDADGFGRTPLGRAGGAFVDAVTRNLRAICEGGDFDIAERARGWLELEWQPDLAGTPAPRPRPNSVEAMLATGGNCPRVWRRLLAAGRVSPAQALANMRSLVLLDVGAGAVATALGVGTEGGLMLDPALELQLFKVYVLMVEEFGDGAKAAELCAALDAAPPCDWTEEYGTAEEASTEDAQEDAASCVRLQDPDPFMVRDKSGQVFLRQVKWRAVARWFRPETPQEYLGMLSEMVNRCMLARQRAAEASAAASAADYEEYYSGGGYGTGNE